MNEMECKYCTVLICIYLGLYREEEKLFLVQNVSALPNSCKILPCIFDNKNNLLSCLCNKAVFT